MLILSLLEGGDMYGYQMIEELSRRSNDTFQMKEGTLYPILHGLEKSGCLTAYQQEAPTGRVRKYYRITKKGKNLLDEKRTEWDAFRALQLDRARRLLRQPLLVDLRNLYDRADVERHGFRYVAVGR